MILLKRVFIPAGDKWIKKDVVIESGIYRKISQSEDIGAGRVLRCDGLCLVPAFIDPHVHVREPGYAYKEDWETCTKAALKGGCAAIYDMPNNKVPVSDEKTLNEKNEIAEKKSHVNFGLYIALTDNNVEEIISPGVQSRVCGIKIYLSKTTGKIMVSSEHALLNIFNQRRHVLIHSGGTEGLSKILFYYEKASKRFSRVPVLYICHVSTGDEVSILKKWKKKYLRIFAEVTPHHLFLNRDNYHGFQGVLPPLESRGDNEVLWKGIEEGTIDVLGTDHAPHTASEKLSVTPPAGFPGLETALPLMFNALKENRIGLGTLLDLTSGAVRKLFSMGVGGVRENAPADCTLLEEGEFVMGDGGYVTKCGWSPFDGWKYTFRPVLTIVNGHIAYDHGEFFRPPVKNLCIRSSAG